MGHECAMALASFRWNRRKVDSRFERAYPFPAVALFIAALLAGGCEAAEAEPDDTCPEAPELWQSSDFDGFLLRCEVVPELCGLPVDSVVREPDPNVAVDVVFVGDGYTEASMSLYRERVRELVDQLSADSDGIVGRDPTLFNFHRVDLVSPGPQVESRPLRSCVYNEAEDTSILRLSGDDTRVERAAANAPNVDLVVVIVAGSSEARASAGGSPFGMGVIHVLHEDSHGVLQHEMGHALIGLHDEYVDFDDRHHDADRYVRWTSNPLAPNLSLSPDEDWGGLVNGAIEGGGRYAYGVYRPTNRCRMDNHEDVEFCPVCSAAIDQVLAARRGKSDGPPRCGIAIGPKPESGRRDVLYFSRDGDGIRFLNQSIDGKAWEFEPNRLRPLASHLPVWFDLYGDVESGSSEVSVTCVDGLGETSEVTLSLDD